jgi:hypothetical protein
VPNYEFSCKETERRRLRILTPKKVLPDSAPDQLCSELTRTPPSEQPAKGAASWSPYGNENASTGCSSMRRGGPGLAVVAVEEGHFTSSTSKTWSRAWRNSPSNGKRAASTTPAAVPTDVVSSSAA